MHSRTWITLFSCLTVACVALAAKPRPAKRLTPERIAELSGPGPVGAVVRYSVQIDGLDALGPMPFQRGGPLRAPVEPARVTLTAETPGVIEVIREFRYPIAFEPPQASQAAADAITPVTPTAFETANAGWTIQVKVKPAGKLIALSGVADFVEVAIMNGGYGAVAGPIYSKKGQLLSPNVVHQPKTTTTSTRFHIFALPGEPYEVTLYRGDKAEKHTVTIAAE